MPPDNLENNLFFVFFVNNRLWEGFRQTALKTAWVNIGFWKVQTHVVFVLWFRYIWPSSQLSKGPRRGQIIWEPLLGAPGYLFWKGSPFCFRAEIPNSSLGSYCYTLFFVVVGVVVVVLFRVLPRFKVFHVKAYCFNNLVSPVIESEIYFIRPRRQKKSEWNGRMRTGYWDS